MATDRKVTNGRSETRSPSVSASRRGGARGNDRSEAGGSREPLALDGFPDLVVGAVVLYASRLWNVERVERSSYSTTAALLRLRRGEAPVEIGAEIYAPGSRRFAHAWRLRVVPRPHSEPEETP